MKLTDKAVLGTLSISVPSFNKLDKQISLENTITAGARDGSLRTHKSLLPTSDLLKEIKHKSTEKGIALIPSANFLHFMTLFRKEKAAFEKLVDKFCPMYPQLVEVAKTDLGTSYKSNDYPHPNDIRCKFSMDMTISNVPADDFRCAGMSDAEADIIRADIQARTKQAAQDAMAEAWQRLYDRVKHLADKLNDPAATFKNTTVEHITELCSILPRLNFADDPNLEAMRQEVEGKLVGYHPDALRNDPDLRRDKAEEANDIMAKMGAFMGAAS